MTRILNCVASDPLKKFASDLDGAMPDFFPTATIIAEGVDIRPHCPPVYDQGQLGACTAFSIGKGLLETLYRMAGHDVPSLSALDLYYNERLQEHDIAEDHGARINNGMYAAKVRGVCPESDDPYAIERFKEAPDATATADEKRFRFSRTLRLVGREGLRACLAEGRPAVMGMACFDTLDNVGANGLLELPADGAPSTGGHAVCVVGYNDTLLHFIVRNSWGPDWGDHGYFYVPYAYVDRHCWDFYTGAID